MRDILLKSIFAIALALSFVSSAHGQQTNIHLSMPPQLDSGIRTATSMSASYVRMYGEKIDLSGIDWNMTFRTAISPTDASDVTVGAALLGSFMHGEMKFDTFSGDVSGTVLHGTYNREYMVMKRPSSNLILFWGIPVSFAHYIIETAPADVTMYTLITGAQGGARLGFGTGNLIASPLLMLNLMGGYTERYDGGVYLANLDPGGIPIFAVLTSGLEIFYSPLNLNIRGTYQRALESGDNKPMNTAIIQLSLRF